MYAFINVCGSAQVSSGLQDMASERLLLSNLMLPALQVLFRQRKVWFDWIDLNHGGVQQAAANAAEARNYASGRMGFACQGLYALDHRCGLTLSSASWGSGQNQILKEIGVTVPLILTLVGENIGSGSNQATLQLESARAWLQYPDAGCEGLV